MSFRGATFGSVSTFIGALRVVQLLVVGAVGIATLLVAGLLPVMLPWHFVVALGAAPLLVVLLWINPALGVGFYLVALLLSPDFKLSDVMTFAVMGVFAARIIFERRSLFVVPASLAKPFWLLVGIVALSTLFGVVVLKNQVPFVYRDGRAFVYWLWVPLLLSMKMAGLLDASRIRAVVVGFAIAVALMTVFQGISGMQVVTEGRVGDLDGGGAFGSITRVQIPGLVFVSLSFVWITIGVATGRVLWWIGGALLVLFAAALYVNFGRALWAWTAFALVISFPFLSVRRGLRVGGLLAIGGAVLVAGLWVVKPIVLENVVDRVVSVQSEGGHGSSFGWRRWENEDAVSRIVASPIYGVGIGGEYRRWISEIRVFEDHTRYVHNAFLFYGVKIGLPGLMVLLWLLWTIWRRAFIKRGQDLGVGFNPYETAVAAFLPAFVGLNITQPELASPFGVLFASLVVASLDWDQTEAGGKLARCGAVA
ncbi:MAG: hypothetical protein DWQ11_10340 [Proteobacteria bacterium]|nr:MAG: hypothetical protein DWQ11_10340 [Pseudomonadota bacterium]